MPSSPVSRVLALTALTLLLNLSVPLPPLTQAQQAESLAAQERIPAMYVLSGFVEVGELMS